MKFHSLMAVFVLFLAVDSSATLLPPAAPSGGHAEDAFVYQNGELVLEIRDSAGAGILRAGLDYFFHDEHIATANELPTGAVDTIMAPAPATLPEADDAQAAQLPEPFSLGLLGAGIMLVGLSRRQGSRLEKFNWVRSLRRGVFPWPALSWLD